MAKFDVDEEALVAAAAAKVASMCIQDASFVQRLVAGSIGGLLSTQQLRSTYDAGVQKALDQRIAQAQATIPEPCAATGPGRPGWRRPAAQPRAASQPSGSPLINDAKVRMRRTIREAVGDLLKDRVDEVLLKLLSIK